MPVSKPRKPQERTAITRNRLLRAAEQVFTEHGYERAQLEEIAKAADFSKGALYAHFKSKEDLLFALAQNKADLYQSRLNDALRNAATREAKLAAFRSFYVNLSEDRAWALLILEVKLFVTHHPHVKQRLRQTEDELEDSVEKTFVELFGPSARPAAKALGGIYSAFVLEANLEPDVFPTATLKSMLGTMFDALLGLSSPSLEPTQKHKS